MAALGKIRQRGVILSCIIGLGIFAFIAGDMFRACESQGNESRQQVGKILDEKISVQQFQKLVDEYSDVVKMTQGDNLSEDVMNSVKDQTWETMVWSKLIENESKELGLTVTAEEIRNILQEGTHPALRQLMSIGFVNQQTGRFDVNIMNKFLQDYEKAQTSNPQFAEANRPVFNYCQFAMKQLREQLLQSKYSVLLRSCMLSNPISAKAAFEGENMESDVKLAYFPFAEVSDKDITVSDADLKAEYEKCKELFFHEIEARDIKYVDFKVVASAADRKQIKEELDTMAVKLARVEDPAEIIRRSGSVVSFLGIPVTKNVFPNDIKQSLDSIAVGATSKVTENKSDNTYNIVRLISKQQLPDSIQFRAIQVMGATPEEAHKRADSIYNALKEGADFKVLAKKYMQTGDSIMLTSREYESAPTMDKDTKNYIQTLNNTAVGELKNIELTQGNIIVKVMARKGMTEKFVAAVVKKPIEFSKDTYSIEYNKFSSFVSQNNTLEDMEKNASQFGYTVKERKGRGSITNNQHNIANLSNTREAMKWLFEAEDGKISPLYECGDNDHLLVLALTKVHPAGYEPWDDETVKETLKTRVIRNKKAEMLAKKFEGVTSIAAAEKAGAKIAETNKMTFGSNAYVTQVGAAEPALSGRVSATEKGAFSKTPVKGNGGVYMFQVMNKTQRDVKFDEKKYLNNAKMNTMRTMGNPMAILWLNANIVDNRYLFF